MNICVTSTSLTASPETFVQAHLDNLAGNIHFLYGDNLPKRSVLEGPLSYYPTILERVMRRFGFSSALFPNSPNMEGISRYLKCHQIDIVFSEFGTTGAEMAPICKKLNIPLVVIFHGGDISFHDLLDAWHDRYVGMVAYASKLLVVSRHMIPKLVELGAVGDQIEYVPCGPNDKFFSVQKASESKQFITVGRFVDKKAPYFTLESFREFLKRVDGDYTLTMIGDGPLLATSKNLVGHWGLSGRVNFLGTQDSTRIAEELSKSFCFLQHSITADSGDSEGTPVGILEAVASGLPVVSTKHAGIPDIVLDGKSGFLVDEKDVHAMTEKMVLLAENPEQATLMGELGRQHVKDNFSMAAHIDCIDNILSNVVKCQMNK